MKAAIAVVAALLTGLALYFFVWADQVDWPVKNDRPAGKVVVAFGDSLTLGFGAPPGESYPDHLATLLGCEIVNAGVNGDTTATALARLRSVQSLEPDVVLVTLGGNDILRRVPLEATLDNLRAIFRGLQESGALVVYGAVDPPLIGGNWVDAVRDVCREEGVLYVASIMDGMWSDTELMSDSIHPSGPGYKILAERFHARLEPHFPSATLVSGAASPP